MISKQDLIFQEWVASLSDRDKTRNAVRGNFEDLFSRMKQDGATLESSYEYIAKAIKAHSPSASLIKNVYKKMKVSGGMTTSEKDFGENWCKDIGEVANAAFFEIFPLEQKVEEPEEPAIYGNMTAKEYKVQRKHADFYPRLDTEFLEKQLQDKAYDPMTDINALLGKNGNSK